MNQKPVLQAFIIADDVYQGVNHRKFCISGTFNMITSQKFPAIFHKPTKAYINLADVLSDTFITLRYIDNENQNVLFEVKDLPLKKSQQNRNVEVIVEMPPFPMPHAGLYLLELWVGDSLVSIARVVVEQQASIPPIDPQNPEQR